MKKIIYILLLLFIITGCENNKVEQTIIENNEHTKPIIEETKDVNTSIVLSFAGDCTLGNYANQPNAGSFNQEYLNQGKDASYFFKKVKSIFENDDLTIVNLEGPLTNATSHIEKQFPFSGLEEYGNILKEGSIEAVTLANNHSEDYYQQGYSDTKEVLQQQDIGYFGYDDVFIKEIKGIKIGFLGYRSMSVSMNNEQGKNKIKGAIDDLKNNQGVNAVIVYYHWGIEREYYANSDQRELAHFTIDAGANLVVGSHPHVIQGLETYNGKQIVYSLGNFCFGGNRNPSDYDSMIYSITMNFTNGDYMSDTSEIIPCRLSSSTSRNDYQPMLLDGNEKQRVLDKIKKYSY